MYDVILFSIPYLGTNIEYYFLFLFVLFETGAPLCTYLSLLGERVGSAFSLGDDVSVNGGTGVSLRSSVELHKLEEVELGLLDHLHLADEAVLEGIDSLGLLLDLLTDGLGDESLNEISQGDLGGLGGHDLDHLSSDASDLSAVGVAVSLVRVGLSLGETNSEEAEGVAVSSLHVNVGLDQRLPLSDQRAELVSGHIHSIEISEALTSLGVLDLELHLSERLVLVLVQVTEVGLADSALEGLSSDLSTDGLGDDGSSAISLSEHRGSHNVVPLLLSEWVSDLLLLTLLALSKSLILANCHCSE